MKIKYDPAFFKTLKKLEVRISKSFRERITIFLKRPYDPLLDNHILKDEHKGYRSIDITKDYRAIYEEIDEGDEPVAYFFLIGLLLHHLYKRGDNYNL